ncbi:MAG: c-type cytochrome [Gammaproteobacteria bacterium]|nr:MAG: c-type cytochrome [Gammaproteobacteria bacterium]
MRISLRWPNLLICGLFITLVGCGKPATDNAAAPVGDTEKSRALFSSDIKDAKVLVFSKTKGWRHDSIPAGIAALQKMATDNAFTVVATEDAEVFTDTQLSSFNAIVFLNTTLDVLDDNQQVAMERFIQSGGGFVGIHAAADTEWEGNWIWYRRLVGAVFKSHPSEPSNVQIARVDVKDANHLSTEKLPASFEIADEWYDYRDFYEFNKVLLTVDEKTYRGGKHGDYHPITWYHDFDGGRSFYTGLGHTAETFSRPEFISLLLGGLKYAVGGKPKLDYTKAAPEPNRFIKKTIVDHLNEPVNLSFFANGDALIAQRGGNILVVDYKTGEARDGGKIEVDPHGSIEFGLLGFAVDPNFDKNQNIYAAYNAAKADGSSVERLSRFKWKDGKLDNSSEQIFWEYHIDQNCCHTGGDLQFGNNGELFVSTGDNSNPFTEEGYGPIDLRDDAAKSDALRGAGNTQDLRGKVLRILPKEAGGYDIPKGNLFSDPKDGRPEIYVMGTRNAYKITYDKVTSTLFYGDIGPDAGEDSAIKGTRGYDEVNRVTKAGNFGWPLFVGNNYAYKDFNYATGKSEKYFDPLAPANNSPRNTGLKILPPAQRPLLWYPYGASDQFPELGKGGRMALVADVYHDNDYPANEHRLPAYYNNKLFILDFMRNWVKAVSFDEFGRIVKIEPFAPNVEYTSPIDSRFAPDGTLYVLEYGKAWFKGNPEASLSRIEYAGAGNRPPLAKIVFDKSQGAAPYKAIADAKESIDLDGDKLTYAWSLKTPDGKIFPLGANQQQEVAINDAGEYILKLDIKDPAGASASTESKIQVGNEPAVIDVKLDGNQSFYWPNTSSVKYAITVNDKEDGAIEGEQPNLNVDFAAVEDATAPAEGHQQADVATVAKSIMEANGCKACHSYDVKVVGPAFNDVAARYKNDKNAVNYLVNKIKKGGNGVWGEVNMPSFATLSDEDRTALATYVLSLADVKKSLPLQGNLKFSASTQDQQAFDANSEPAAITTKKFALVTSYTDKGSAVIGPITVKKTVTLEPARLNLSSIVDLKLASKFVEAGRHNGRDTLMVPATGAWLSLPLGHYDLTGVNAIRVGGWIGKETSAWQFELRLGSPTGPLIGTSENPGKVLDAYLRSEIKLQSQTGFQDVFLLIRTAEKSTSELELLDVSFHK